MSDRALPDMPVAVARAFNVVTIGEGSNYFPRLIDFWASWSASYASACGSAVSVVHFTPVALKDFWDLFLDSVFKASYNLLYDEEMDDFLEICIQFGCVRHLEVLLGMQGYRVEVFQHALFKGALRVGLVEIVRLILEQGFDLNNFSSEDWSHLARPRNVTAFQLLLQEDVVSLTEGTKNHLRSCITDMVSGNEFWISRESPIAYPWNTNPLELSAAAYSGDLQVVQTLLDLGADPNASIWQDRLPLEHAVRRNHSEVVQLLLQSKADPNGWFPCLCCASRGNVYDQGPRQCRDDSKTPIQAAASMGSSIIVQLLLDNGAEPNATACGVYVTTALQEAIRSKNLELVTLLLKAGADINASLQHGYTALEVAFRTDQNLQMIALLLNAGADVNASFNPGHTALQNALTLRNLHLVQLLLNAGADVNACALTGHTAFEIAVGLENPRLLGLILDAGAEVNMPVRLFRRTELFGALTKILCTESMYVLDRGVSTLLTALREPITSYLVSNLPLPREAFRKYLETC